MFCKIREEGCVPQAMKYAIILPLYEHKGNRSVSDCNSYQGIALLFTAGNILTPIMFKQLRVGGRLPWNRCSAPVSCQRHHCRRCQTLSAGRIAAQLAWRDSNLRFDCHARKVAKACNFHSRVLRHVRSLLTDDVSQPVACSVVASRLQRPAVRRTGDDIRQTAARPEQPGQSRLPMRWSHRRQTAATVAPLISSEAAGHLQGGSTDSQSAFSHSGVSQRPGTYPRTNMGSSFI